MSTTLSRLDRPRNLSIRSLLHVSPGGRARFVGLLVGLISAGCSVPVAVSSPGTVPTPTTTASRDYSRIESEVLVALNRARTDPRGMASTLEALIPYYNGTTFTRPGSTPIRTNEGANAVRGAVAALRAQAPVGSLTLSAGLTRAARDHVADQGRTGNTGHTGSDGSSVDTRVSRYGAWTVTISENIDYSPVRNGGEVIESLLIDDGVPSRGHRVNIYGSAAKVAGIACGPHPTYGTVCVIVQAGGFIAK